MAAASRRASTGRTREARQTTAAARSTRRVQVIVDLAPWFPPPAEQEDADEPE